MAEKEKVEVEEIIGLVKTDEPTNSVQLKKEAQLSICEKRLIELLKENEQLKSELQGMEELLKSYRKTIKHDAGLLADATKNGYLPPLEDWK